MQELPKGGAMVSIAATVEEVAQAFQGHEATVSIAAVNGPKSVPIAFEFNESLVGKALEVLIDAPAPEAAGRLWVGRSYADAPDVDGVVYVTGRDLEPGDLVRCSIVGAEGYDLVARLEGSAPPRKRKARPRPRKKPRSPFTILN